MVSLKQQILNYCPSDELEVVERYLIIECMETFYDVLERDNKICHFTSSAFIVNNEATEVIMAHHNIYNSFAFVGGHADGNSNLLQVAIKEAFEEADVMLEYCEEQQIAHLGVLAINSHFRKGRPVTSHMHLNVTYIFFVDKEKVSLKVNPDENTLVEWIPFKLIEHVVTQKPMIPIYQKLSKKAKEIAFNNKN